MTDYEFFADCTTQDEIKAEYRRLAKIHHPDLGGSVEVMTAINLAYEVAVNRVSYTDGSPVDGWSVSAVAELVRAALEKIIALPGIQIEICGDWIWVSGDTKPVKDALKAAGYHWAPKKDMWYYAGRPSRARRNYNMDEIRNLHGSEVVQGKTSQALSR